MPKYIVIDQLNHGGVLLGPNAEVDLPLNVAGDSAVRGHIKATDAEGELAFTSLTDPLAAGVLRAGAPLAEHEMAAEDAQLQSERVMFEQRIKAIDLKLADNATRRELLRKPAPAVVADAGAPAGPAADFAGPKPGPFAAPAGGAPAGPGAVNDGPDVRHAGNRPGE